MKFIADVMLGSLAKRLRLLGLDVVYDRNLTDNDIIRISLEQGRMILTRDAGLARRPLAANHVYIQSENRDEQVDQVLSLVSGNPLPPPLTRCSLCNTVLTRLSKNEARDLVPDYVYRREELFLQCGTCGRVYWTGSHVRNIERHERRKSSA